jgi:hypothetical protein
MVEFVVLLDATTLERNVTAGEKVATLRGWSRGGTS